jgi:hypothetical protein
MALASKFHKHLGVSSYPLGFSPRVIVRFF